MWLISLHHQLMNQFQLLFVVMMIKFSLLFRIMFLIFSKPFGYPWLWFCSFFRIVVHISLQVCYRNLLHLNEYHQLLLWLQRYHLQLSIMKHQKYHLLNLRSIRSFLLLIFCLNLKRLQLLLVHWWFSILLNLQYILHPLLLVFVSHWIMLVLLQQLVWHLYLIKLVLFPSSLLKPLMRFLQVGMSSFVPFSWLQWLVSHLVLTLLWMAIIWYHFGLLHQWIFYQLISLRQILYSFNFLLLDF